MKNQLKKSFATILAGILTASVISGCGDSSNKSSSNSSSSLQSSKISSETSSPEIKTISILSSEAVTFAHQFKMSERDRYPVWAELDRYTKERGFQFEFELIPDDQYAVIIQTRTAAANKLPDMVAIGPLDTTSSLNLGKSGIIQPINELIESYSDGTAAAFYGKGGPGELSNALNTDADGSIYWFSSVGQSTYKGHPMATSLTLDIRKDWIEKLGLSVPATAEEFLNVLQAFQDKDANGNELPDEVLICSISGFVNGIAQWFGLVNGTTGIDFQKNKVVSPWYQDGIKEYFTYMKRLYDAKILDPNAQETQANAANAMAAIYSYAVQTWFEPATGDPDAAYLPLPPLPAMDGVTPIQIQGNATSSLSYSKYAFTKNCSDKETMGKVLDLFTSDYFRTLSEWGIEGVNYKKNEQGLLENILADKSMDELAADGTATGYQLWGFGPFPRMAWGEEWDYDTMPSDLIDFKKDYQKAACQRVLDGHPIVYADISSYFAMPTAEELEKTGKFATDLQTYSSELSTKLIIGESSLDNWDTYRKDLKDLGLDELIAIQQAQYERYLKAMA